MLVILDNYQDFPSLTTEKSSTEMTNKLHRPIRSVYHLMAVTHTYQQLFVLKMSCESCFGELINETKYRKVIKEKNGNFSKMCSCVSHQLTLELTNVAVVEVKFNWSFFRLKGDQRNEQRKSTEKNSFPFLFVFSHDRWLVDEGNQSLFSTKFELKIIFVAMPVWSVEVKI